MRLKIAGICKEPGSTEACVIITTFWTAFAGEPSWGSGSEQDTQFEGNKHLLQIEGFKLPHCTAT